MSTAGARADAAVGFFGGVLGGIGGYSGVVPAIWAQLRGWPKDVARAFYQPFIVMRSRDPHRSRHGGARPHGAGIVRAVAARPALGAYRLGLYGRLDENRFRQIFAVILVISGVVLVL